MKKSLLMVAAALTLTACSNDVEPGGDTGSQFEQGCLSISIKAPSTVNLSISDAYTRATIEDEADEARVKTADIFVFSRDAASDDYNDYKFVKKFSFVLDDTDNVLTKENENYVCDIKITDNTDGDSYDLENKEIAVAVVANDAAANINLTTNSGLDDIRSALATNTITSGNNSDVIAGNENNDEKKFPMSAIVEVGSPIPAIGANVDVELTRCMARVDIFNNTPNLKITGVKITNVNNKSSLFRHATAAINVPDDASKIEVLNPLAEYSARLTGLGLAYQSTVPDSEEPSPEELRKANTHRAFYLYEQSVTSESTPQIEIEYTLNYNAGEGDDAPVVFEKGKVNVDFFSTKNNRYVDIRRNHVYTVILGNGKEVLTDLETVTFEEKDWEPEDFYYGIELGE